MGLDVFGQITESVGVVLKAYTLPKTQILSELRYASHDRNDVRNKILDR